MELTCSECRHWESVVSVHRGLCRRYAPRATIVAAGMESPELGALWPTTLSFDRCGDWFPREGRQWHPRPAAYEYPGIGRRWEASK